MAWANCNTSITTLIWTVDWMHWRSIENQLIESGMQFQQMTGAALPEMEADDEWEERLY